MLEQFYNNFGFAGSLLISLFGFLFLMFWFAGIAGLIEDCDDEVEMWKVMAFMLFPPYPIFWLIMDMYRQYRYMNSDVDEDTSIKKSLDETSISHSG